MMNKFFKKFKEKIKSDKADSVLTGFIIMAIPVAMLGGIAIDVSKNMHIRSQFMDMGQRATQASIMTVGSDGSLNWDAAHAVVKEYDEQRFSTEGGEQFGGSTDESFSQFDHECNVDSDGLALPYYTITLDTERGSVDDRTQAARTVSFTANELDSIDFPELNPNSTYRVVDVVIRDSAPNFMLGMIGLPCQNFNIQTSAIAFGENSDI